MSYKGYLVTWRNLQKLSEYALDWTRVSNEMRRLS